mgnify:CR=1 FL=1
MARVTCTCGEKLSNHEIPNDIQLKVYTDREWEAIFNCENIQPWMIPAPKYDVWRCPMCKKLYVYDNNKEKPIIVYKIEKSE